MASLEDQICNAQAARQLAEDADQAKTRFLAAASHDLRQPIHALGLFLSALDRRNVNEKKETLINADSALKSCREMLEALLDFSRIEAGIVTSSPIDFSLQPLLFRLFKEFGPETYKRDLVLRLNDTVLAVYADPILVELNVRNLLSNAMRYTERGGILIGVRRSRVEQTAILEIWDTGMSIPEKYHQDIFREFYQLGNPERDQRKGLGLGLAIVAGLNRAMGTRVSFKSRWQRGSVFRLHLPLAKQAVVARKNRSTLWHENRNLINCRVLMVDDNESIRLAVARILDQQGCDSRVVTSIDEAVALLGEWSPEILVTDYRLEGEQTGGDAVRLIRERVGKPLPAIVVTGDTSPERLREVNRIDATLLHKPLSAEKLLNAIALLMLPVA
jgi:CheY-like chemotaxis protein